MKDEYVQVPVSLTARDLLAQIEATYDVSKLAAAARRQDGPPTESEYAIIDALLSQPTPTAESRDHDLVSVVDGTTWVQRNDGWQHVDVLDREFRMRRSAFHGLMVGVDGHWAYVGDDEGRMRDYLTVPAPVGPPRIEEMAPGTTFTACMQSNSPGEYIPSDWDTPKRWFVFGSGRADRVVSDTGWPCMLESIDPSTIRDVTPPKDAA